MTKLLRQIRTIVNAYDAEFGPDAAWAEVQAWLFVGAAFWLFALLIYAIAPVLGTAS